MTDEELLAQSSGLPTIYCDGYGAFRKVNGVMRCIGYVFGVGAQVNLITSLAGADAANRENRRVLDHAEPTKGILIWNGGVMAH